MSDILDTHWHLISTEPNTGCWIWVGADVRGYGKVRHKRKMVFAHRHSWELSIGPVPEGMNVLHKCDVTYCVNPDHLTVGTQQNNVDDCSLKGRIAKGPRNAQTKLTLEQVRDIRKSDESHKTLSEQFGVSKHTIHGVKHYWWWVE